MNILSIYPEKIFPVTSGGRQRISSILNRLSQKNSVSALSFTEHYKKECDKKVSNIRYVLKCYTPTWYDMLFRSCIRKIKFDEYILHNDHPFFYPSHTRIIRKYPTDIVLCSHYYTLLSPWITGLFKTTPLILDQQNVESDLFPGTLKAEKFALKHADFVTCCSEEDRRKMIAMV
ncbi:glycosyltransferase, partial [Patescibacteria group bacterium]|nr:glycosyltransferase [Patescibacteria group bacterium]